MARQPKRTQRVYDKYSELLGERYSKDSVTGWCYFERGAKYTRIEMRLLLDLDEQQRKQIHKLKTIFGGEVQCLNETDRNNRKLLLENNS